VGASRVTSGGHETKGGPLKELQRKKKNAPLGKKQEHIGNHEEPTTKKGKRSLLCTSISRPRVPPSECFQRKRK